MADVAPKTAIDLTGAPSDRAVSILMRHGERPPLPPGEAGRDVALTDRGRCCAQELGRELGRRLATIRTSAIRRCQQTAEAIIEGAGVDLAIRTEALLGEPGAFVADGPVAWNTFKQLGNQGLTEHLVNSDQALPGMVPPLQAVRRLIALLTEPLEQTRGYHVFVTHDLVLAPFVGRVLGLTRVPWPGFLHGALLWREGDRVRLSYAGQDGIIAAL